LAHATTCFICYLLSFGLALGVGGLRRRGREGGNARRELSSGEELEVNSTHYTLSLDVIERKIIHFNWISYTKITSEGLGSNSSSKVAVAPLHFFAAAAVGARQCKDDDSNSSRRRRGRGKGSRTSSSSLPHWNKL
jgi:hypothetical protein